MLFATIIVSAIYLYDHLCKAEEKRKAIEEAAAEGYEVYFTW